MILFPDTSVWSLALRRDTPAPVHQVQTLFCAIDAGETIATTGLILQELLQGFAGPKSRQLILERFSDLPLVRPDRDDHIEAAELRNLCRRNGVQVTTVDVLLAQICIRNGFTMLAADSDFDAIARLCPLQVCTGGL